MIEKAREILKHRFGYDSFRMNQEAVIEAVLDKQDCIVLMPTGEVSLEQFVSLDKVETIRVQNFRCRIKYTNP